jgi:hypothetical protein
VGVAELGRNLRPGQHGKTGGLPWTPGRKCQATSRTSCGSPARTARPGMTARDVPRPCDRHSPAAVAQANAASEHMIVPVAALGLGFMALVGYAAFALILYGP